MTDIDSAAAQDAPPDQRHEEPAAAPPARRGGLKAWIVATLRVLTFRTPNLEGLRGSPWGLALLFLVAIAFNLGVQRLYMEGPVGFLWGGFLQGWVGTVLSVWLCWIVARSREPRSMPAVEAGTLLALMTASALGLMIVYHGLALMAQAAGSGVTQWSPTARWVVWAAPLVCLCLIHWRLLWPHAGSGLARALCLLVVPLPIVVASWLQPSIFWWSEEPDDTATAYRHLTLNEDVLAAQARFAEDPTGPLTPTTPGRVNVYAITYAPYSSEDVFMRESAVVAQTMESRFGAAGRTVQLVLNPDTVGTLPWATPSNLRRTLRRMATVMDREHDVLFLHLTSHGGRDGRLAVDAFPLELNPVTPADLKRWLDEAGIQWRVISISACFSGSWIEPLADENTLVMTAADADHTSYGCGSRSPLTFFGRAMYEEALRTQTWSFREALSRSRAVIDQREREAGKTDGYSNPQIREGGQIAPLLDRLASQQSASPTSSFTPSSPPH